MLWLILLVPLGVICEQDTTLRHDFLHEAYEVAESLMSFPMQDALKTAPVHDIVPEGIQGIFPIRPKSNWDWIKTFKILGDVLAKALDGSVDPPFNMSVDCLKDFDYYVKSQLLFLGATVQNCNNNGTLDPVCMAVKTGVQGATYFSAQVLDATGKIEPGFFDGNFHWWGRFDECRRIISESKDGKFRGQYCLARRPLDLSIAGQKAAVNFEIGTCFPDTCSNDDIMKLLGYVSYETSGVINTGIQYVLCKTDTDPLQDGKAFAFIVFASVWALIMVIATAYEYFFVRRPFTNEDETTKAKLVSLQLRNQNIGGLILLSFSLITNSEKILTLEKGKETITCLHGMRFLSMAWVILGHTYVLSLGVVDNIVGVQKDLSNQFLFQAIGNATLSVDTFFLLSGFLLAYLWLKEAARTNGSSVKSVLGWILFYVHRYLRLTPVYMIILFFEVCYFAYITNGPVWYRGAHDPSCEASWYYNLFYLNNFFNLDKQCLGHTWYLANDMQFHWFSPLLLVPLYFFAPAGFTIGFIGIVVQMVLFGYYNGVNNYAPSMNIANPHFAATGFYMGKKTNGFNEMYIKPYMRMGPYIVGILLGYILHTLRGRHLRMKHWFKFLMRFITIGLNCVIIYGVFDYVKGKPMPKVVNGLYSGTRRTVWAINLSWIIFECVTGNGGLIEKFLSLRIWLPVSRLTYCAYLIHPLVIYLICNGQQVPLHYSNQMTTIYLFLGNLGFSYLIAFIFSVAFEAPFLALEKLLINGLKEAFQSPVPFGQNTTAQVSPESSTATDDVESAGNSGRFEDSNERLKL